MKTKPNPGSVARPNKKVVPPGKGYWLSYTSAQGSNAWPG